ncbi:hypothetical protein, partial [Bacillus pumilus]|uniref:hypothetical protein n=1 Tax=Bacillus pumilus TaxID=1408 RepID=UPI001C92EF5E
FGGQKGNVTLMAAVGWLPMVSGSFSFRKQALACMQSAAREERWRNNAAVVLVQPGLTDVCYPMV